MKFFIATKNPKKLLELERILKPLNIEFVSEKDLKSSIPEVEETGKTFEENAMLKAKSGCINTGLPTIADDSGLCVDALLGAPGIYSARFAGEDCNDQKNIDKLLKELKDVPKENRTARFVTAIAVCFPDGKSFTVRGICEGYIATERHGTNGFGYDPVFMTEKGCFGEMSREEKDKISHRGKALAALNLELKKYI